MIYFIGFILFNIFILPFFLLSFPDFFVSKIHLMHTSQLALMINTFLNIIIDMISDLNSFILEKQYNIFNCQTVPSTYLFFAIQYMNVSMCMFCFWLFMITWQWYTDRYSSWKQDIYVYYILGNSDQWTITRTLI